MILAGQAETGFTWAHGMTAVVTVLAVLLGVWAEAGLRSRRDRRDRIETAVARLTTLMPQVVTPMWGGWTHPRDSTPGSPWSTKAEEVSSLLNEVELTAQRFRWSRWANKVITEARDVHARYAAAEMDYLGGKRHLIFEDLLQVNVADLFRAVFGKRALLEDAMKWYQANGFRAGRAPTTPPNYDEDDETI